MPRNLLLYRFIIVNAVGAALLVWAGSLGYVRQVFKGGLAHSVTTGAITALFLAGLASAAWHIVLVNAEANKFASYGGGSVPGHVVKLMQRTASRFEARHAHLWDVVEWIMLLSLIGNAVGLFVSSRNIDSSTLATTEGIVSNSGTMLGGVAVAVSATIVGGVACLWTWINVRMLDTASALHVEELK